MAEDKWPVCHLPIRPTGSKRESTLMTLISCSHLPFRRAFAVSRANNSAFIPPSRRRASRILSRNMASISLSDAQKATISSAQLDLLDSSRPASITQENERQGVARNFCCKHSYNPFVISTLKHISFQRIQTLHQHPRCSNMLSKLPLWETMCQDGTTAPTAWRITLLPSVEKRYTRSTWPHLILTFSRPPYS